MAGVGGSGLSVRKSPRRIDVFPLVGRLLGGQKRYQEQVFTLTYPTKVPEIKYATASQIKDVWASMKRANNVLSQNGYSDFYSTVSQDFLVAFIFVATLLNSPLLRQDPCTPVHGILHVTCARLQWHIMAHDISVQLPNGTSHNECVT